MAEEGAVVPDEGGEEVEETPPPAPKYALELAAAGAAGAAAWALGAEPADGYVRALFFFWLGQGERARWGGAERARARWAPRGAAGRGGGSRSHFVLHFEAGRECARAESEEAWRGEPLPALRRARVRALVHFFFFPSSPPRHSHECAQPRMGVQSRVRRRAPTRPILNPRGARLRADVNARSDGCRRATPSCAAV